jgi:cob(I)alamin adenosyltransferase
VKDGYSLVTNEMTAALEKIIKEIEAQEISFKGWATPGANLHAAALDMARTIARRAERRAAALQEQQQLANPEILVYLNRLSDLVWLFARWAERPQI